MRLEAVAAPIAEQQLGLVVHHQLVQAGVSPSSIRQAADAGRLRRLERSVYLLRGVPRTHDTSMLAKVLSVGEGAMLSHRSAAWLWGLLATAPSTTEISVPRHRRPRTRGVRIHRCSDLDLVVPGRLQGIPVTDVGRTILDCASLPDIDLELLVDEARRRHRISRSLLPFVVATHARPGRAGIGAMRRHLQFDEMPHSDFERLVTRWLPTCGITGWRLHHRLVLPGYGPCEADIAWPAERVILELEGGDHRDRSTVHDHDTERQNALALAGWQVLRVTYRRWVRHTDKVRTELQTALEAGAATPRTVSA